MTTIAIVTGFTKSPQLPAMSLAPIVALKRKGVIDRILAVTWDSPEIDTFVAPVAAMPEVELVRVPQPLLEGAPLRNGLVYQIRNLQAALALVDDPDALVLKMRPDFVADPDFLEDKILHFARYCAPSSLGAGLGIVMPSSPFAAKIWLPWADANQPFFYEDGTFMGLKRDVQKLADSAVERHLDILSAPPMGWFAHILRFTVPFLKDYPIFRAYLKQAHFFPNILDYRMQLLPAMLTDAFFLHLLVAHAWILATSFHVDCGAQGQLALYTNTYNAAADWSRLDDLKANPPYDSIVTWRDGQKPGGLLPGAQRAYGRLVDDSWQQALFTQPTLRDVSPEQIRGILRNVMLYRQGLLAGAESEFIGRLETVYRQHGRPAAA